MSSSNNRGLALSLLALILLAGGVALALLWAPEDADQGISQRIFYIHVPIALTSYACFGVGAWKALRLLWTRGDVTFEGRYFRVEHSTCLPRPRKNSPPGNSYRSRRGPWMMQPS